MRGKLKPVPIAVKSQCLVVLMYHCSCFRIHSMLVRPSILRSANSFYIFFRSVFLLQSSINPHCVQCAVGSVVVGYSYITNGNICLVACPANSNGLNVPSGCSCDSGFSGIITMSSTSPYYSGSCSVNHTPAPTPPKPAPTPPTPAPPVSFCLRMSALLHGNVSNLTSAFEASTVITYSCNAGYELRGVANASCGLNGN